MQLVAKTQRPHGRWRQQGQQPYMPQSSQPTFVRTFCMRSMAKGVMNPSDPMANGTSGGTGPLPRIEHVHKTVPSPPRVITQSSLSATGRGISPVSGWGSQVTRFPDLIPDAVLTLMLCSRRDDQAIFSLCLPSCHCQVVSVCDLHIKCTQTGGLHLPVLQPARVGT